MGKHGFCGTALYRTWCHMKGRCYNEKDSRYKDYGERGIEICDSWRNNFESFMEWSLQNGYHESLTIDRIDNNGKYEPNNCKWSTKCEQNKNRRSTIWVSLMGRTMCLKDWCNELNMPYKQVHYRVQRLGWNIETALLTPIRRIKYNG